MPRLLLLKYREKPSTSLLNTSNKKVWLIRQKIKVVEDTNLWIVQLQSFFCAWLLKLLIRWAVHQARDVVSSRPVLKLHYAATHSILSHLKFCVVHIWTDFHCTICFYFHIPACVHWNVNRSYRDAIWSNLHRFYKCSFALWLWFSQQLHICHRNRIHCTHHHSI